MRKLRAQGASLRQIAAAMRGRHLISHEGVAGVLRGNGHAAP
jgi:hypothetical protein